MESYKEIWDAVLFYCKEQIPNTAFDLWIVPIQLDCIENGKAVLRFSSTVRRDIFISQYHDLVKSAFESVLGFEIEFSYICAKEPVISQPVEDDDKSEPDTSSSSRFDDNMQNNAYYTFDNFIVGPSNKFAYAAAKAVAADPGGQIKGGTQFNSLSNYNPLFIYGNSGLGKTHILNAICNEVHRLYPEMKIMYVTAEEFANEFYVSLQRKTVDEFNEKYRNNIDLFLVDDIQFIGGKEQTIEQFFHTFSALHDSGKQIVLSSDRLPKEIPSITDRLKNRFEDGLLADIQPPEFETRCAIIKKNTELKGIDIPQPVIEFIAEKVKTNIRHLEGITNKIGAKLSINEQKPTIAMAQALIKEILEEKQPLPITIQRIVEEVSRTTGVSVDDIYSKNQKANVSHARKITLYVIRKVTNLSYERIGEEFDKHYATIIYNVNEMEKDIEKDQNLKRQVNDIINNINNYN